MYFKVEYIQNSQVKTKIIKAKDIQDAYIKFRKRNIGIIKSITEYKKKPLSEILKEKLDLNNVNLQEVVALFDQMYVMLDAGIAIDLVLKNIIETTKDKKLRKIFTQIYNDISAGFSLTDAFKKHKDYFGTLVISMIQLGEETGDLANALKDLSTILNEILDNRRRLKKAVRYPIFIIFAMVIAFVVVILFVIPPFKEMFSQLNAELPLPTQFLLWVEHAIVEYGGYILTFAILGFLLINYYYKKDKRVKYFIDKMMLKIYIVGDVIELAMKGRFIYVFERLLTSGIPIIDALDIALNIVDNDYLKSRFVLIKNSIQRGDSVTNGFKQSQMFENMIVQMVSAGEESGSLNIMLRKVSNYYLEKYRYYVDNISTMIEPILIMAIAGFILVLALGIFLPMWNLTQTI